jgi:redox-sensitive bicupin YhaK (pirin superfamily)
MLTLRRAEDRGHSDLGWLDSHHTFSFGGYSDPGQMGFRALRVINDDRVAAGKGFGAHGHRDMEILSYVIDGRLAHKDSMGEAHELGPNEVQAMSAGNGVIHSEYNASATEPTHFLQIWIVPAVTGVEPSYQQFAYDPSEKRGKLRLIAGPAAGAEAAGTPPAARIHQDARMYASVLAAGESVAFPIAAGRYAWVQCVSGEADVNGLAVKAGDGVAVSDEASLVLRGAGSAGGELLLFDLA